MNKCSVLNGNFGALFEAVTRQLLQDKGFQQEAYDAWCEHRGLVVVRGPDLAELSPQGLVDWASVFGTIDEQRLSARAFSTVEPYPILRIGNTKNERGELNASFAEVDMLDDEDDGRYNPDTLRPVWHTDSTFLQTPPIGSVFHCRKCPPRGGETLFADMQGALEALDEAQQSELSSLEAVCSLAHHDKKVNLYSPSYPTLSAAQRAENPPNRVPLVLTHPVTGAKCLYGMNSSTCAVVPKGEPVDARRLDVFDLEGIEDESVMILRRLLPKVTAPQFTVRWRWRVGDIAVWDNRATMHAATGFEHQRYEREMWRLTLLG